MISSGGLAIGQAKLDPSTGLLSGPRGKRRFGADEVAFLAEMVRAGMTGAHDSDLGAHLYPTAPRPVTGTLVAEVALTARWMDRVLCDVGAGVRLVHLVPNYWRIAPA